jgi:hypothetical protein
VLGRRSHGELVHVGLAERHHVGQAQLAHDGGVVRRNPALQDLRAGGRRHVEGAEHVLDRDRDTGERAELVARAAEHVDALGGVDGILRDVQEGVHVTIDGRDAVEVGAGDLHAGDLPGLQQLAERGRRQAGEVDGTVVHGF